MIFSADEIFSQDQAVTADAISTNVIDLGEPQRAVGATAAQAVLNRDIGNADIPILIQVAATFNNCTSITITVRTGATTTPTNVRASMTVLVADLVAGRQLPIMYVPRGVNERYVAVHYDVTGTPPAAGAFTAGITMGNQTNNATLV